MYHSNKHLELFGYFCTFFLLTLQYHIHTFRSFSGCSAPSFGTHSGLPVPYILRFGSEEMKQRYLPGMVTGKIVGSLAMTEPAAGRLISNS